VFIDTIPGKNGYFKNQQELQKVIAKVSRSSKWQWGVQANGGFSNISQNNFFDLPAVFGDEKSYVEDLSNNNMNSPTNSSFFNISINPPLNEASEIRTGYAWSLGGFVQRNITNRFSMSAGLNYAYYSVQTTIGQLVTNQRSVNVGQNNSQLVEMYYGGRSTHNYTSNYYFIALPVTTHTQLNRSANFPLVIDAGLVLSRLLSTTALHYDGTQGIYFKNNDLFNNLQLGMDVGLTIGILQQSKHPVSIGPAIHYSFSRLVKKDVSSGQYLWSSGLNVKMLLKK
jgi:hypothetical protein